MDWDFENNLIRENNGDIRENFICGTDEAGRGPLAGDVFSAAVILPHGSLMEGLNDSKKLSEKKREFLYEKIIEKALFFRVCSENLETIKAINILNASQLAMVKCVKSFGVIPDITLVDGNIARGFGEYRTLCVIRGDTISPNIAAASILAKVERDRYMKQLHEKYPMYNFIKNKGYATKEHIRLLKEYGPCPEHRIDFIKHFFNNQIVLDL